MRVQATFALALLTLLGCAPGGPSESGTTFVALLRREFPEVQRLPDGFWPEGITFGRGTTYYVGSLLTGAIYQADARTGVGKLLVPARPGREMVGMKYDARCDRLIVAGGLAGVAYVYDASTGAELASFTLADSTEQPSLVNDVALTPQAAYLTDSFRAVLYRIPLGSGCSLPPAGDVQEIPLGGEFQMVDSPIGNANGIVATPDGSRLVVVNTSTGILYRVNPTTGQAAEIDLSGATLNGDGMLLIDGRLYVVEGALNQVTVVRLDPGITAGSVERAITSAHLRFPSTIAMLGSSLYAVNARFDVEPGPQVEYEVVRLTR